MWFSVVYSFTDNDTRHHSGQNVVPSECATNYIQTIYNAKTHSICFYHNIKETKSLS